MTSNFLISLFAVCCIFGMSIADDLTIQTSTGILHGKRSEVLNKSLRLFLGIPYAEPPIGNLRFKRPIELLSEDVERDTAEFGPSCYQSPHLASLISPLLKPNEAEISEDCLYLNVYIPGERKPDRPLSVMVWLAGEGFSFADPRQFDGRYLAVEGDVIVVTVGYRLGVFGFLNADTVDAPGNAGLFDQRMALKWVKKNIAKFGGNPQSVTLFGRFTGSMSAAIHAFSPLSKQEKLFDRVILQSGVPVGDWVFERSPLNTTFLLAEATDCVFENISDVISCLRNVPTDVLLSSSISIPETWRPSYDSTLVFENTLKSVIRGEYAPLEILVGITNDEGSLCTTALSAIESPLYQKFVDATLTSQEFKELLISNMLDVFKHNDTLINKLAIYNYNTPELPKLREEFVKFCGDMHVKTHALKLADITAQKQQKIFVYEFVYRPSFSSHPEFIRAAHGDDVLFTMGLPLQLTNLPEGERQLTNHMVKMIANFARSGNPSFDDLETSWPEYTAESRQILKIGKDSVVEQSPLDQSVEFWHGVIPAAQNRSCAAPAMAAFLTSDDQGHVSRKVSFLGSYISVPTAEYLMVALGFGTVVLFILMSLSLALMVKVRALMEIQELRENAPFLDA
ncbi:Cholinesterase, partial [Stegodyphus mimosarum]